VATFVKDEMDKFISVNVKFSQDYDKVIQKIKRCTYFGDTV